MTREGTLPPEPRDFPIQLNPDGVAAPARQAAMVCREVIDLYFQALDSTDLSKPPPASTSNFFRFSSPAPEWSTIERRAVHENWILPKAFQELMRGVRASLEEAYFFAQLASIGRLQVRSSSTLGEILAPFREKATKMNFPSLLAAVNLRLDTPLEFADAFESMQKARNCLEHRNGVVGGVDVDVNGEMRLRFPRLKGFVLRGGHELEIYRDMFVEAGEKIFFRTDVRIRVFRAGDRLTITSTDFDEIAFACSQFATDLAARLPKVATALTPPPPKP
ncbi:MULTISPECIES: hypothetical protein [unclassified Bradyrhizobium]|uniref:hypothetical protein n=1 Tax=unclassified Bradyrhizobium TaxID=2631580 RepID=UPI0028E3B734|nr:MULTISPECIES: hypothetical protein [unclassified Bradyrhizobium]